MTGPQALGTKRLYVIASLRQTLERSQAYVFRGRAEGTGRLTIGTAYISIAKLIFKALCVPLNTQ